MVWHRRRAVRGPHIAASSGERAMSPQQRAAQARHPRECNCDECTGAADPMDFDPDLTATDCPGASAETRPLWWAPARGWVVYGADGGRVCGVLGCREPFASRGRCRMHYERESRAMRLERARGGE